MKTYRPKTVSFYRDPGYKNYTGTADVLYYGKKTIKVWKDGDEDMTIMTRDFFDQQVQFGNIRIN